MSNKTQPNPPPSLDGTQVHLAWAGFQRRQVSMREIVGFECWFFPVAIGGAASKMLSYLRLSIKSVLALRAKAPDVVWVQMPQVPLLWAVLAYRATSRKPVRVIADCHNAQLRKPWSNFPFALKSLHCADVILVHNESMLPSAKALGWPMNKVLVLEDIPAVAHNTAPTNSSSTHIHGPKPWILFPGSFAVDEPINAMLDAARAAPEMTFIITGRQDKARQNGHQIDDIPPNVILPGFLELAVFDDLLRSADVVVGLTLEEGIQLSVCNEALGFGRPLVTADTQILRALFGEAAILVNPRDPHQIVNGCRLALQNSSEYAAKSVALAAKRLAVWKHEQLSEVIRFARTIPQYCSADKSKGAQ